MDDNKVLTLASNERIALTSCMRLLFEVGHLRSATPATVSRGLFHFISIFSFPFFENQFKDYIIFACFSLHSWHIVCEQ